MVKRLLYSIFILFCFFGINHNVSAKEFLPANESYYVNSNDVLEWPFSSVVQLDKNSGHHSSGVVVGQDYVLTAGHSYNGIDGGGWAVVTPGKRLPKDDNGREINPAPFGKFWVCNSENGSTINPSWQQFGQDYALVKIEPRKESDGTYTHIGDVVKPLTIPFDRRASSEPILSYGSTECAAILGYPSKAWQDWKGYGKVMNQMFESVKISSIPYSPEQVWQGPAIQGFGWFGGGMSGGPLLNNIGQVIGTYKGSSQVGDNTPQGTFAAASAKSNNLLNWGLKNEKSRVYFFNDKEEWDTKRRLINPEGTYIEKLNWEKISRTEISTLFSNIYSKKDGYYLKGFTDGLLDYKPSDDFQMPVSGGASMYPVWEKLEWGNVPWKFEETTGILTFIGGGTFGDENSSPWKRKDEMHIEASKIKKIIFTENVSAPINSYALFGQMGTSEISKSYKLSNLDGFENLNYLDTSQVTDMSYMFAYCGAKALNVSSFNTTKVKDMTMMFGNNANLESLDLTHFDVTQVQSMKQLVSYNRQLKKILMPSTESSSVKDLKRMFIDTRLLTELDLSKINTAKVSKTNLNEMLSGMTGLKSLVLGPQSYLDESVDLPEIQKSDNYTGNWVKMDGLPINMGASSNFVKNYNGSNPGTYTWELETNSQNITGEDYSMYVGDKTPTAADFKASASDKTGATVDVTVDFGDNDVTRKGVYNVTLKSTDDQTKTVKLTVKDNKQSIAGSGYSMYVGDKTPTASDFKASATDKDGNPITVTIDFESKDLTKSGVYDVALKSFDGQTIKVKLTVLEKNNQSITMYRTYNPNNGEHFYTQNVQEKIGLLAVGWKDEGIGWYAPTSGDSVYRVYNPNVGDHHYTLSTDEKTYLVSQGWKDEGIGWFSGGDIPLYRQYNPNAKTGSHNFTTSINEKDSLIKVGWKDEGISWYVIN